MSMILLDSCPGAAFNSGPGRWHRVRKLRPDTAMVVLSISMVAITGTATSTLAANAEKTPANEVVRTSRHELHNPRDTDRNRDIDDPLSEKRNDKQRKKDRREFG